MINKDSILKEHKIQSIPCSRSTYRHGNDFIFRSYISLHVCCFYRKAKAFSIVIVLKKLSIKDQAYTLIENERVQNVGRYTQPFRKANFFSLLSYSSSTQTEEHLINIFLVFQT